MKDDIMEKYRKQMDDASEDTEHTGFGIFSAIDPAKKLKKREFKKFRKGALVPSDDDSKLLAKLLRELTTNKKKTKKADKGKAQGSKERGSTSGRPPSIDTALNFR